MDPLSTGNVSYFTQNIISSRFPYFFTLFAVNGQLRIQYSTSFFADKFD